MLARCCSPASVDLLEFNKVAKARSSAAGGLHIAMVAGDPAWVAEYKAILSHAPTGPAKSTGGPGGCTVCCTGFSLFGAVFLLVVAAAMKGDYPYMHIEGT